jgi:hypothetical protein
MLSVEEHLSTYDGLPTKAKMKLLSEQKGLPASLYDKVWSKEKKKQLF